MSGVYHLVLIVGQLRTATPGFIYGVSVGFILPGESTWGTCDKSCTDVEERSVLSPISMRTPFCCVLAGRIVAGGHATFSVNAQRVSYRLLTQLGAGLCADKPLAMFRSS